MGPAYDRALLCETTRWISNPFHGCAEGVQFAAVSRICRAYFAVKTRRLPHTSELPPSSSDPHHSAHLQRSFGHQGEFPPVVRDSIFPLEALELAPAQTRFILNWRGPIQSRLGQKPDTREASEGHAREISIRRQVAATGRKEAVNASALLRVRTFGRGVTFVVWDTKERRCALSQRPSQALSRALCAALRPVARQTAINQSKLRPTKSTDTGRKFRRLHCGGAQSALCARCASAAQPLTAPLGVSYLLLRDAKHNNTQLESAFSFRSPGEQAPRSVRVRRSRARRRPRSASLNCQSANLEGRRKSLFGSLGSACAIGRFNGPKVVAVFI